MNVTHNDAPGAPLDGAPVVHADDRTPRAFRLLQFTPKARPPHVQQLVNVLTDLELTSARDIRLIISFAETMAGLRRKGEL